jgi:hypothetical protein
MTRRTALAIPRPRTTIGRSHAPAVRRA